PAQPSPARVAEEVAGQPHFCLCQPSLQAALFPNSVCLLEIPAKMPSQLEYTMETVMFTFYRFAGDKNYLTKGDLWVLMEKEVPGYMENQKDPMAIDQIMKNLEECRDGKISFEGYLSLFAGLTNGCNEYYIKKMKPTGKKF
ncbi:hypothetical protein L345_16082, partial [Ophiophagus hannah]